MSSATKRAENVQRLLEELPQAEIVEAVNGKDPQQIAGVHWQNGDLHSPYYPFPLSKAEIGVFQSHRKCWQKIIDDDLDYALIVEDDLQVDPPRLKKALKLVEAHATPDMYIRLPIKKREWAAQTVAQNGSMTFILPRVIALQCVCQVVGKNAARKLLAATEQIDRPVDTFLQMHWETGQPIHAILPNGNQEVAHEIGGSTIQTQVRGLKNISRELKRAWYRVQVALKPQRP
jgi:GR25 family glycosyltransferase involved in LPS biosynthesis